MVYQKRAPTQKVGAKQIKVKLERIWEGIIDAVEASFQAG